MMISVVGSTRKLKCIYFQSSKLEKKILTNTLFTGRSFFKLRQLLRLEQGLVNIDELWQVIGERGFIIICKFPKRTILTIHPQYTSLLVCHIHGQRQSNQMKLTFLWMNFAHYQEPSNRPMYSFSDLIFYTSEGTK